MALPSSLVTKGWSSMGYQKFTCAETTLLFAIFGPYENKSSKENEVCSINVVVSHKFFHDDSSELEAVLTKVFSSLIEIESYPRSAIQMSYQIFSKGPELVSSCIRAGFQGLLESGVKVKYQIVSDDFYIGDAHLTIAGIPGTDEILYSACNEAIPYSTYFEIVSSFLNSVK